MTKPPKHLLELSEAELKGHLREWEQQYLVLTEYLGKREEIKLTILNKLKLLLPTRKDIMRNLPEIIGKFEKDSNLNLYCKATTTTLTGLFNSAVLIGILAGKDVSPELFSGGNTLIGSADLAIEWYRHGEEKATLNEIREELQKEKKLKESFCDSIKDLKEIRKKIMNHYSEYNKLTMVRIFSWHEMWSRFNGQSLSDKEKEAEKEIFSLGKRLSSLCSTALQASYHAQGGFTAASGILALFLDDSSKGILAAMAAGNVLLSIIGGIEITREFQNGSEFLQCLRDDYASLEAETRTLEKLKEELASEIENKQTKGKGEEKKRAEGVSKSILYLFDIAQQAAKKNSK